MTRFGSCLIGPAIGAAIALSALAATRVSAAEVSEVKVLHWLTSPSEAAGLNVIKKSLEAEGVTWSDVPVAGGDGDAATTALKARVAAGDPPTAVQLLGTAITDWAEEGLLGDLTDLAEREHWADHLPPAVVEFSKYKGKWVAAPTNLGRVNWLFISRKALDRVGGTEPKTFADLVALAEKFKAAGITPLALGGQDWQEAVWFEDAVLSIGGPDFYRKVFVDLDPEALHSDKLRQAFGQIGVLRKYVAKDFAGRDWNIASAQLSRGEAGIQAMGDSVKGELIGAGLKPDVDFLCSTYPGTSQYFTFFSDQFAFFNVDAAHRPAQLKFASVVVNPQVQIELNLIRGQIPVNTQAKGDKFDACGKKSIEARDSGAVLVPSLAGGYSTRAAPRGAFYDVLVNFFQSDETPDEAVEKLNKALAVVAAK